jgi:hypothetical protein
MTDIEGLISGWTPMEIVDSFIKLGGSPVFQASLGLIALYIIVNSKLVERFRK